MTREAAAGDPITESVRSPQAPADRHAACGRGPVGKPGWRPVGGTAQAGSSTARWSVRVRLECLR